MALTLTDDSLIEGDETLTLQLGNLQSPSSAAAAQIVAPSDHEVTIENNDEGNGVPTLSPADHHNSLTRHAGRGLRGSVEAQAARG